MADILMVVTDVSIGDFNQRVAVSEGGNEALAALTNGINEMIDALEASTHQMEAPQRELEEKLETIRSQQAAIEELSTPIIPIV